MISAKEARQKIRELHPSEIKCEDIMEELEHLIDLSIEDNKRRASMKVFTDQVSHAELEVTREKLEELGYRVKYLPKGPLSTVSLTVDKFDFTEIEINVYF
ncbi:hypothetical protein [Bacillus phage SPO1L4]|nr:hypothetical protein Goe9_c00360 [Bacillus phage vB_BsuM-Goe9]WIT26369.1 hypothetical protein [Bacillus phage SPO1L3]WIT26568.1 hypothetical protein [Bacillus phage SPO1L4]WIT26767.1 hypothetical protein [Bacillus phage SPO1L5]